jgi:hypothetical protein
MGTNLNNTAQAKNLGKDQKNSDEDENNDEVESKQHNC